MKSSKDFTVMRFIKLKISPVPVRLHSSYGKLIFVIILPFFAIFKNVVHSLEPGETPSYSAFNQAPIKLCATFLNISKDFKTVEVWLRLIFQFTYVQYCRSLPSFANLPRMFR